MEKPQTWRKTSGCTGGITSDEAQKRTNPILNVDVFPAEKLVMWMEQLFDSQQLYRKTRGVHCSLLTDGEKIIAMAEDIGRHNTLDKIAGKILRQSLQPNQCIILTTGRISSEMLQKAARIGASVVISRTSPTSLFDSTGRSVRDYLDRLCPSQPVQYLHTPTANPFCAHFGRS